jgi:hypothetical protein
MTFVVELIQKSILLQCFHHLLITIGRRNVIRFEMFGTKHGEKSCPSAKLKNVLTFDKRTPLSAQEIGSQMQSGFPGPETCGARSRYQVTSL